MPQFNMAAFAPEDPKSSGVSDFNMDAFAPLPENEEYDADGFFIPEFWRAARRAWNKLAIEVRSKFSAKEIERLENLPPPKDRKSRVAAPRFTTQYAINWGRKQGMKLVDRERYDSRTRRHHDLMLGVDALMTNEKGRLVGIQGAGKGERRPHYVKFEAAGGVKAATERGVEVIYVEFVRGNPDPILIEHWA